MYTITLEVNQICNLRCNYCYLGQKNGTIMEYETAIEAIDIAFINVKKHQDAKIWVDFVGGEALLNLQFLKRIQEWIHKKTLENQIIVIYSITTNGSIMNAEILEWLVKNNIRIKLSIDGEQAIHDQNRTYIDGKGSYEKIISNLPYFKEYECQTGLLIQAAHVITHNNYKNIHSSVQHLADKLQMKIIDSSIDMCFKWKRKQLDYIGSEWEKVLAYCIGRRDDGMPFMWGIEYNLQQNKKKCDSCVTCGVGLTRIYVKVDGSIYGCAANLSPSGYIGNVKTGFILDKLEPYKRCSPSKVCMNCNLVKKCQTKACISNQISFSGESGIPNPTMCYIEKIKQKLFEEYM